MSKIFSHATPKNPCPICKKTDWCTFGDRAMLCQRVESAKPHAKGGWWHFYEDKAIKPIYIPKPKAAPPSVNAEALISQWQGSKSLNFLAQDLGVHPASLSQLGAAWAERHNAWAFPMTGIDGNVCGIRLRNDKADKWAVTGSRQGIFLPTLPDDHGIKVAFLPEGPTDTAALLTMGLFAIGRPSCNSGGDIIKATLNRLGIYKVVVVADNDELKQLGSRQGYPGIEGAMKLKKELGLMSVIWMPPSPIKDAREFLRRGGTREVIESEINKKVWSKQ